MRISTATPKNKSDAGDPGGMGMMLMLRASFIAMYNILGVLGLALSSKATSNAPEDLESLQQIKRQNIESTIKNALSEMQGVYCGNRPCVNGVSYYVVYMAGTTCLTVI